MHLEASVSESASTQTPFDMDAALFCGGLAFDAYVEPPKSRWERGSKGWKVAFCSAAFTRSLYKGLLQIQVNKITDLPSGSEADNVAEDLMTGKGVDACLLAAVLEGAWKEDIDILEKQQFHEGVLDLTGAAHVGRTSTAWANVDEKASKNAMSKDGIAKPYHIKASWGKGGQAIWPEGQEVTTVDSDDDKGDTDAQRKGLGRTFNLYVQDPATARIVFTVADDNRMSKPFPIGSTYRKLRDLIPGAANTPRQWIDEWKNKAIAEARKQGVDPDNFPTLSMNDLQVAWEGALKLSSKPRKQDKQGQMLTGAAAGAALAGPMGAAAGAALMSMYEGEVRGVIHAKISFLPILPQVRKQRSVYNVQGGMPGITWGDLYKKYLQTPDVAEAEDELTQKLRRMQDLEHCFFVNHEETGSTCAVYRSLEERVVIVSFRGTCQPIDLLTDTTLTQEAWVEGEDIKEGTVKVHQGFRTSMNSISRRLKELILAIPSEAGCTIADFDMLVTGHSLGGALATLFTADIGEYGVDGGRGLPQQAPSDEWWKSIANTFLGARGQDEGRSSPPRPRSLHLYNFGSPRVGNEAFRSLFDSLVADGRIKSAFRVVNGEDVVTRLPRTLNGFVLGNIGYEHVGTTVLVEPPEEATTDATIWIEGVSDDRSCPVRDGVALTDPMSEGSLLSDLLNATKADAEDLEPSEGNNAISKLSNVANKIGQRVRTISPGDIASIVGINRQFTEREGRIIQSLLEGKAIAHHMEDQYYASIGRASGFIARVNENLVSVESDSSVVSRPTEETIQ